MAKLLSMFHNRGAKKICAAYPNAQDLVEGLRREEDAAIQCLSSRIAGSIYQLGKTYKLVDEDIEELHCDCIMVMLDKIRTGKYEYQGFEPSTYVIEIARLKVRNFHRRSGKSQTDDLSPVFDAADEPDYGSIEQVELLEKLLTKLNENCQKLIRLKYLEEFKDKEVIEQQITQYSTVDALKNHRAQCMKKLIELGAHHRMTA